VLMLPPELRARIGDLRLSSRGAARAGGIGWHPSRQRGAGLEFSQYRAYEPGDELRHIDWKLYARSDRYFVREAERDSPLQLCILVDASASMAHGDASREDPSKLGAAKWLAACAIELALRQGDRFGLIGLSGQGLQYVAAHSGPRQRDRCLLELNRLQAIGAIPEEERMRSLWQRVPSESLVLMLSDGFDARLVDIAQRLATAKREVVSIQILSIAERDFPFQRGHRFIDPETGDELLVDGESARRAFIERFGAARAELAMRMKASRIRHTEYVLDESLDAPLRRLFAERGGV
jgi:uncharacterized protein (DUF58 family)